MYYGSNININCWGKFRKRKTLKKNQASSCPKRTRFFISRSWSGLGSYYISMIFLGERSEKKRGKLQNRKKTKKNQAERTENSESPGRTLPIPKFWCRTDPYRPYFPALPACHIKVSHFSTFFQGLN